MCDAVDLASECRMETVVLRAAMQHVRKGHRATLDQPDTCSRNWVSGSRRHTPHDKMVMAVPSVGLR
jgi:hypothetical protein